MYKNLIIVNKKERAEKIRDIIGEDSDITEFNGNPCAMFYSSGLLPCKDVESISEQAKFPFVYMAIDDETEDNVVYFAKKGKIDQSYKLQSQSLDSRKMKESIMNV